MGTSTSFAAAGAKLGKVGQLIDGTAKRDGLNEIGKESKQAITKAVVADLGADQMMRNKKVRVSTGYEFQGSDAVVLEPRGGKVIWRWLVDGVAPHAITPHAAGQGASNLIAALTGGKKRSVAKSRQSRSKTNEDAFRAARSRGLQGGLFWSGAKHPVRYVRHPGMKEKGTWDDGVRRVRAITPGKVYDQSIAKAIGKVF
jgi:hypothetical protein